MSIIKASFIDFEQYSKIATDWEIDFRLLSKDDFSCSFGIFTSKNITLSRTKLNGTIEQLGLTPEGCRTIAIPVNYDTEFIWHKRKINGSDLLIFPKSRVLDAISYNNFDVFVVSIKEDFLTNALHNLGYSNTIDIFDKDKLFLFLSKEFSKSFYNLASNFLCNNIFDDKNSESNISEIVLHLLNYIEYSNELSTPEKENKKDFALKKAIQIINDEYNEDLSIPKLCELIGISERTLQYAFKDKYKVSPNTYIKAFRLNKIKNELFAMKGEKINIADIAGKYHFWHMGEFAKDFKQQFGILPSQI